MTTRNTITNATYYGDADLSSKRGFRLPDLVLAAMKVSNTHTIRPESTVTSPEHLRLGVEEAFLLLLAPRWPTPIAKRRLVHVSI